MLNDLFVFKRIRNGDIKAFEDVFRQYYYPLYVYSCSIVNEKGIAEEIVQELFYTLWKDREHFQIVRSLKSYLYGAVRNQSLQYCEHRNVQERHRENVLSRKKDMEESTPLEELEYKELEEMINRTLEKLPPRRFRIFQMHRMEGRKYKEIAEILSVSVKTVEAEMTKTYQILRHEIEKYTHTL